MERVGRNIGAVRLNVRSRVQRTAGTLAVSRSVFSFVVLIPPTPCSRRVTDLHVSDTGERCPNADEGILTTCTVNDDILLLCTLAPMLAPPPEDTGAARTDATHGEHGTRNTSHHGAATLCFFRRPVALMSHHYMQCRSTASRVKPGRPTKSVTSDEKTRRGTHAAGPPGPSFVRSPGAGRVSRRREDQEPKNAALAPRLTTCELRSMPQADQRNFTRVCPHTTVRAVTTPHAIRHSHDVRLNAAGSTAGQHIRPPPPHAVHSGAPMGLGKNRLGRA